MIHIYTYIVGVCVCVSVWYYVTASMCTMRPIHSQPINQSINQSLNQSVISIKWGTSNHQISQRKCTNLWHGFKTKMAVLLLTINIVLFLSLSSLHEPQLWTLLAVIGFLRVKCKGLRVVDNKVSKCVGCIMHYQRSQTAASLSHPLPLIPDFFSPGWNFLKINGFIQLYDDVVARAAVKKILEQWSSVFSNVSLGNFVGFEIIVCRQVYVSV